MKYAIENLKGQVKIKFTITAAEWDGYMNTAYNRNKNKFTIPGFRKGHASRKMIEKMYGGGVFFDDAFNFCFKEAYTKVLDENQELYPVDEPQIDIEKFDDKEMKFTAVVTVKPELELGAYTGIKVEKVEYTVTADEVSDELDRARERAARTIEVIDREVKDGDIVNLDYCGKVNGVAFKGGTAEKQELTIGSRTFIPGFEEQMVGMKIGETKDLNVKFPDEYHSEDLKGKDAVFTVTVNGIKVKEVPEMSDELVKEISRFDTVDAYREDIEKRLTDSKTKQAEMENENKLIEAIVEATKVEIPDCMVNTQLDFMLKDLEARIGYMYGGMKIADYFKYTGSSEEQYKQENKEIALKNVKTRLVLEEIIKKENLYVTDEEFNKEIAGRAEKIKKSVEEYEKNLDFRQINYIKNDMLMKKLTDFLKSNNTFEAK